MIIVWSFREVGLSLITTFSTRKHCLNNPLLLQCTIIQKAARPIHVKLLVGSLGYTQGVQRRVQKNGDLGAYFACSAKTVKPKIKKGNLIIKKNFFLCHLCKKQKEGLYKQFFSEKKVACMAYNSVFSQSKGVLFTFTCLWYWGIFFLAGGGGWTCLRTSSNISETPAVKLLSLSAMIFFNH